VRLLLALKICPSILSNVSLEPFVGGLCVCARLSVLVCVGLS
jgi:hypothetical protein